MFSLKKTKKAYQTPRTAVAEVDLEGLICQSLRINAQVDEINDINSKNVNKEPLYFEF